MLEPWEVAEYLLRSGLVSVRSIRDGDLEVSSAPRRNNNYRVVCEYARSYLLKQAGDSDAEGSGLREAVVYRYLLSPARASRMRAYLPRFYSFDESGKILVLELIKDAEESHVYERRIGRFPVWLGAEMGRALAALHRTTGPEADTFRSMGFAHRPWVLSLHRPTPSMLREMSAGSIQMIGIMQQTPELGALLDDLRGRLRAVCLVHGDVKASNWLVPPLSESRHHRRLKLIDWEMAGAGDPRWDAGSVFADYLIHWVSSLSINAEEAPEEYVRAARYPLDAMQPAINRFWQAYARGRGLRGEEYEDCLTVSVMLCGARLIQTAYEQCQELTRVTLGTLTLLQLALNIMQQPREAAADLLGIEQTEGTGRD